MTFNLTHDIVDRFCVIFLSNTEQAVIFDGKHIKMAATVEGFVTNIDDQFIYLSEKKGKDVNKIVPKVSIGYIHIEPSHIDEMSAMILAEPDENSGDAH